MNLTATTPQTFVNWKSVIAIVFLNFVVLVSWIVYHFFQPQLLAQFGFASLNGFLSNAKNMVLVLIPPLAGLLADFLQKRVGKGYLIFTVGISITAMVFMAAAYAFLPTAGQGLHHAIPAMMVVWLICMNIFYTPATAYLEKTASTQHLPLVTALVALTAELLMAVAPYTPQLMSQFNSSATFVGGGLLIALSGYFFYQANKDQGISYLAENPVGSQFSNLLIVFIIGFFAGLAEYFVTNSVPVWLKISLGSYAKHTMSIILAIAGLLALPVGKFVQNKEVRKVMVYGFCAVFSMLGIIYLLATQQILTQNTFGLGIVLCFLLALSTSFVVVSAFPVALWYSYGKQENLGIGIFWAGVGFYDMLTGFLN
jgi:MFS family permease